MTVSYDWQGHVIVSCKEPITWPQYIYPGILTSREGKRALILYSWGTMLSKSINLKEMALTACTAWLPQLRSSASKEPGPYKYNVSLSSSARWHILRGEGTASLVLNQIYGGHHIVKCNHSLGNSNITSNTCGLGHLLQPQILPLGTFTGIQRTVLL